MARRSAAQGGSLADPVNRKGRVDGAEPSKAAAAFREAAGEPFEPERFERVPTQAEVRSAAKDAVRRGNDPEPLPRPTKSRTKAMTAELTPSVGATTAAKLATRLADAARAYDAERYADAKRILQSLVQRAPDSPAVRELYGLVLYRTGKWADAVRELDVFVARTKSTEQHPVLADCHRALGHHDVVEKLWVELRDASPSAELVAEGRIVYAGDLADRGELDRAIAVVEPATRRIRGAKPHQLRLLYVLADLIERSGDIPRARTLFDRILVADPDFADARARRRSL